MTGAEAAALRVRLGYSQGALAALLQVSTPTVSRREGDKEVPAEYAELLQALQPAPEASAGRGPYRRAAEKPAQRRQPLPTRAKAGTPSVPALAVSPARAASPLPRPVPKEEPVLEAEEAGAVLLEGESIVAYWAQVVVARHLVLARIRQRRGEEGRLPCR